MYINFEVWNSTSSWTSTATACLFHCTDKCRAEKQPLKNEHNDCLCKAEITPARAEINAALRKYKLQISSLNGIACYDSQGLNGCSVISESVIVMLFCSYIYIYTVFQKNPCDYVFDHNHRRRKGSVVGGAPWRVRSTSLLRGSGGRSPSGV